MIIYVTPYDNDNALLYIVSVHAIVILNKLADLFVMITNWLSNSRCNHIVHVCKYMLCL